MAAATLANTKHIQGVLIVFSLTAAATTNTLVIPVGSKVVGLVNKSDTASLGYTISGNTITLLISAGTPDVDVVVSR